MVRLPCSILSLDVQDVMGSHIMNIGGNLKKFRLSKDGKVTGEYKDEPANTSSDYNHEHEVDSNYSPQPDYQRVKEEILNSEGCRVFGAVIVNKVNLINLGSRKLPYFITRIWTYHSRFGI